MKIGIFSDSHYSSAERTCGTRYNSLSLGKMRRAYEAFAEAGCELVVCLGDVIDTESTVELEVENLIAVGKLMGEFDMKTVCLMGNHDAFVLTGEQFYSAIGLPAPTDLHIDGKNLIFLDACYFRSGVHYAPGDTDWRNTYLPCEGELAEKLRGLSGDTYLFIHQNIDVQIREDHRISNSQSVFDIINQSGVVKSVFQGHYHGGHTSECCGVNYVTLPAMCEGGEECNSYIIVEI